MSRHTPDRSAAPLPSRAPAFEMGHSTLAILAGGLWLLLWRHLAAHWSANEQYSFGWLVPPLALFLGWRQWMGRPAPGVPERWGRMWMLASAAAFLPVWMIAQPNPDWRLVSWALASVVVAFSLGAAAAMGGKGWARHFAFPIGFIFCAVPWPGDLEMAVVAGLMRAVAGTTVTLLNFLGTPALQQGNLIETRAGLLGIDEACSGVRSLQATLMAALFLGEFYRFTWLRRSALLAAGVGIAFATNVGRAFLLTQRATSEGAESVARWHDPLGFGVALVCFALVWGAALLLSRGAHEPPLPTGGPAPKPIPAGFLCAVGGWIFLSLLVTELWFRTGPPPGPRWTFAWPSPGATPAFLEVPIEPQAAAMLQHDEGRAAAWTGAEGRRWMAYHLRWHAGPARSRILAHMHRPEQCLPSSGWRLAADRGTVTVPAGELALPFRALRFEQGGTTAHVWFCLWEDRRPGEAQRAVAESMRLASLQAVLRRERRLGQQVLEAVLFGAASAEEADAAFGREIAARIQPVVPK